MENKDLSKRIEDIKHSSEILNQNITQFCLGHFSIPTPPERTHFAHVMHTITQGCLSIPIEKPDIVLALAIKEEPRANTLLDNAERGIDAITAYLADLQAHSNYLKLETTTGEYNARSTIMAFPKLNRIQSVDYITQAHELLEKTCRQ